MYIVFFIFMSNNAENNLKYILKKKKPVPILFEKISTIIIKSYSARYEDLRILMIID